MRALIVAGGTGGHLSPGTALATEFFLAGEEVEFLSLEKNRNYPDLASAPFPVHYYNAPSLQRKPSALLFPFRLIKAMYVCSSLVRKAQAVVLMGGFPCLPAGLMARLYRRPVFLCEQNAVMGRANRFFAQRATTVFLTFPLSGRNHPADWPVLGNPVRRKFLERTGHSAALLGSGSASKRKAGDAAKDLAGKGSNPGKKGKRQTILVAGGSQGARQLNEMVLDLAKRFAEDFNKYDWVIQVGLANEAAMKEAFAAYTNATVIGFDPDIHRYYAEADLLLCRSGAGVLTEAFLFGLPCILVPYPFATDGHQKENAMYAKIGGAAELIDTRQSDAEPLHEILITLDKAKLDRMAEASKALARPEAASAIMQRIRKEL